MHVERARGSQDDERERGTLRAATPGTGLPEFDREAVEAQLQRILAPHRAARMRRENRAKLPLEEQQVLDQHLSALHRELQDIEAKNVRALGSMESAAGTAIAIRILQPTAEQVKDFHDRCAVTMKTLRSGTSPALQAVARAEVDATLDAYIRFPRKHHVVAWNGDRDFFQAKFADDLADVVEHRQYFSISSLDQMVFQGNPAREDAVLRRYGYLFALASWSTTRR